MQTNWVFLVETANDLEADIIRGFLQEAGIPTVKADSSSYTSVMRVISGQAQEVHILVPEHFLEQAHELLHEVESDE